jgi:hypothetical protein
VQAAERQLASSALQLWLRTGAAPWGIPDASGFSEASAHLQALETALLAGPSVMVRWPLPARAPAAWAFENSSRSACMLGSYPCWVPRFYHHWTNDLQWKLECALLGVHLLQNLSSRGATWKHATTPAESRSSPAAS